VSSARTPIGEILLRHEHLRPRELERVLAEPDRKQRLVSVLILRALIDGDDATLALSEQTGYPGALERHLERRDPKLVKTFPPALMKSLAVVPLIRTAAGALVVIARDPSPALADVLRAELATPVELAVTPAIFIDRLVQRLTNSAPAAGPPQLPPIDRAPPARHRKTVSVIMNAPLPVEPEPAAVRISSTIPVPIRDDADPSTGLAPRITAPLPIARATPPIIQIPERGSGVHVRPEPGSGANPRPQAGSGSGPTARPDGSGPIARPPREGSGANPRPPGPHIRPREAPQDFETRTPPPPRTLRPPAPPRPPPPPKPVEPLKLDLEDEWTDAPVNADLTPIVETPAEELRRLHRTDAPINVDHGRSTREIPIAQLEALAEGSSDDTANIDSRPPVEDPAPNVSSRPTRPAVIVPTDVIEALERDKSGPTSRATPNIIKRPPTPLPVAPQPTRLTLEPDPEEPEPDLSQLQVRPTRPRLEPPPPSPANDAPTVRAPVVMADAPHAPIFNAKIGTDLSIVREIEKALSRATADRLLIKHASTRWNALLLVTIANDRAKGARGHGPRLQAGVEAIELTIASSSLLQAACDPSAALPDGKDPLFDLLGGPTSPSSAPVVVNDRVVAVLAAGDAIGGGNAEELKALAGALAVAYQRFPAK
jgi:hypothetical protein